MVMEMVLLLMNNLYHPVVLVAKDQVLYYPQPILSIFVQPTYALVYTMSLSQFNLSYIKFEDLT